MMKNRIKELRKYLNGISQTKFADKIKISRSALSKIESGENLPSEQTIALICKEFNVNETWLRTGKGEIFHKNTIDLSDFPKFNELPPDEQEAIADFVNTYLELDDISRDALKAIAYKLREKRD